MKGSEISIHNFESESKRKWAMNSVFVAARSSSLWEGSSWESRNTFLREGSTWESQEGPCSMHVPGRHGPKHKNVHGLGLGPGPMGPISTMHIHVYIWAHGPFWYHIHGPMGPVGTTHMIEMYIYIYMEHLDHLSDISGPRNIRTYVYIFHTSVPYLQYSCLLLLGLRLATASQRASEPESQKASSQIWPEGPELPKYKNTYSV